MDKYSVSCLLYSQYSGWFCLGNVDGNDNKMTLHYIQVALMMATYGLFNARKKTFNDL